MASVKKGNEVIFSFIVKYSDGTIVSNLNTAVDIAFMEKINKLDDDQDAIFSKDLSDGVSLTATTGEVQVRLTSHDTEFTPLGHDIQGDTAYYFALQIDYPGDVHLEGTIKESGTPIETITVTQDVIRDT
jgi:hypothetical protein